MSGYLMQPFRVKYVGFSRCCQSRTKKPPEPEYVTLEFPSPFALVGPSRSERGNNFWRQRSVYYRNICQSNIRGDINNA